MPFRKSTAALVLCIVLATAAAFTGRAAASNGAFVVNRGNSVGDNCSATVDQVVYTGVITHLVINSGGQFNLGCAGSGAPVGSNLTFGGGNNALRVNVAGQWTLSFNGA